MPHLNTPASTERSRAHCRLGSDRRSLIAPRTPHTDEMTPEDPLDQFLVRPSTPPAPEVLAAIKSPIDPEQALALSDIDRLLDPAPLETETGWCRLPDGVGYVAVRTPMPGTTAAMWDWWFDWHQRDSKRYQVWYPEAHFGISFTPARFSGAKSFWGATHFPDEDIGIGREVVRIDFKAPTQYGFSRDALDDPRVGTIVGGLAGSPSRHMQSTVMAHVFLAHPDGLVLRSRFWLGSALRPYLPGVVGDTVGRLMNRPALRRRLPFEEASRQLAHHCAVEYARLAALLPELYGRFGES
jgi:hypothetical protein